MYEKIIQSSSVPDQWRSNPLATLAIARGGTFQAAAKFSRYL